MRPSDVTALLGVASVCTTRPEMLSGASLILQEEFDDVRFELRER